MHRQTSGERSGRINPEEGKAKGPCSLKRSKAAHGVYRQHLGKIGKGRSNNSLAKGKVDLTHTKNLMEEEEHVQPDCHREGE